MTSTAPPAPAASAAIETAQELDAVARALFALLLPGAVGTAAPQPPEPARQEAPTAAPAPPSSPAEHTTAPALAPIALTPAPTTELPGVQPPSSQPAPLPLPAPVTIEVPPLDDAGQSQWPRTAPQHPAPRTMAMLTEIGFLDD